jgi:hypothetical protein
MNATGILIALALAAPAPPAAAQRPARPPTQIHGARPATAQRPAAMSRPSGSGTNSFKGIATKLNTTPDAMEAAYKEALQANPKLRRGQFVAANVLAQNLVDKHPGITTQAILDGLKSGKSIGQTLQGLGLSAADAQAAQRSADREIRAARS